MVEPGNGSDWSHLDSLLRNEVATRAWSYASSSAVETTPSEMIGSLLPVRPDDLRYLQNLVLVRDSDTAQFLDAAERILTRLAQTSIVETVERRVPAGHIDWTATVLRRVTSGDPQIFVLGQPLTNRDLPENRLLKFLLITLREASGEVLQGRSGNDRKTGWVQRTADIEDRTVLLLQHPLLQGVAPIGDQAGWLAARRSRIPGYSVAADTFDYYRRLTGEPGLDEVRQLLSASVLIPEAEYRAYELLVLFRIVQLLENHGFTVTRIRVVGVGRHPVVTLRSGKTTVRLDYQFNAFPSRYYTDYLTGAGYPKSSLRPDITMEFQVEGEEHIALFEMKCATSPSSIGEAVSQLLGYHYDLVGLPLGQKTALIAVTFGGAPKGKQWPAAAMSSAFLGWVTNHDHLEPVLHELGLF